MLLNASTLDFDQHAVIPYSSAESIASAYQATVAQVRAHLLGLHAATTTLREACQDDSSYGFSIEHKFRGQQIGHLQAAEYPARDVGQAGRRA
jgi:hypothetical protein